MYKLVCMESINALVSMFGQSWTEVIQTRYIVSKIAPLYFMLHVYKVCISK